MLKLELITRIPNSSPHPTPILFVHGAWHSAWCWDEHFLPYFAQHGYASHALNLRGHGASEGREHLRWTSIADYVADVAQMAGQLPTPPIVIGHSMGGFIVQRYLESQPAPAAVLLASIPPAGIFRFLLRYAGRHPLVFLMANLTLNVYRMVGTSELAREAFFSADMPDTKVKAYFARVQSESYRMALDTLAFALPKPARVKAPMLVLGAARDTIFSPREVEATARAYHAQVEFFPNMAHDMMLEADWQSVADRILSWLAEHAL